jgi:hypothetical protein
MTICGLVRQTYRCWTKGWTFAYKLAPLIHDPRYSFSHRDMLSYFVKARQDIEHTLHGAYSVAILLHGFLPKPGEGRKLDFREDLDGVIGWSIRRTGNKLISSRRATIRRERRIRELRVSSSSFCVRLRSVRVNARSRLNSSLWPQSERTHQVGEMKNTC